MITSQWTQRVALSAALLVLPLILYCGEIAGNPHPEAGSTVQAETVTSSVLPAAAGASKKEEDRNRNILADMKNGARSGS
jgi:hypothetical protein